MRAAAKSSGMDAKGRRIPRTGRAALLLSSLRARSSVGPSDARDPPTGNPAERQTAEREHLFPAARP